MKSKKQLTLIELMIVLLLLGILSTAMSYPLRDMYQTYSFNGAVQELKEELTSMKRLSLIHQTEITAQLIQRNGEILLKKSCDEAVKKDPPFFTKKRKIRGIDSVYIGDEKQHSITYTFKPDQVIYPDILIETKKKKALLSLN